MTLTPERRADLRDLLTRANQSSIQAPIARGALAEALIDGIGGHGDLYALLDIAERFARIAAILEPLRALEAEAANAPWKTTTDFDGSDWLVCGVGVSHDMRKWDVTTDGVRASELRGGAEEDASLICAARNAIAEMLRVVRRD